MGNFTIVASQKIFKETQSETDNNRDCKGINMLLSIFLSSVWQFINSQKNTMVKKKRSDLWDQLVEFHDEKWWKNFEWVEH